MDKIMLSSRPGWALIQSSFSSEEIRIVAQMEEQLRLSKLAEKLKDPDAEDLFWDRLIEHGMSEDTFQAELLQHLGLTGHPKGPVLVGIALNNSKDLQDAYLMALDLVVLL